MQPSIKPVVEELRIACAAVLPPTPTLCAYLYGSLSRGEAGADSDADVALFCRYGTRVDPVQLASEVSAGLSGQVHIGRPLDCRVLDHAPLLIRFRAMQQGALLYESDHNARCELESLTGRMFSDWKFHLEPLSRQLIHQLAQRGFGHG